MFMHVFVAFALIGSEIFGEETTTSTSTSSSISEKCGEKLKEYFTSNQVLLTGILGGNLIILTKSDPQQVYSIPAQQVTPHTLKLTGVLPVLLSQKWPSLPPNSLYHDKAIFNKYGSIAINLDGIDTMLFVWDWSADESIKTVAVSLQNSVSINDNIYTGIMPASGKVWISSNDSGSFYIMGQERKEGNMQTGPKLSKYTLNSGTNFKINQSHWVCKSQASSGKKNALLFSNTQCDSSQWPEQLGQYGFTDNKNFYLFDNNQVYIFDCRAFTNPGQIVRFNTMSYDKFITCPNSSSQTTLETDVPDNNNTEIDNSSKSARIVGGGSATVIVAIVVVVIVLVVVGVAVWYFFFSKTANDLPKEDSSNIAKYMNAQSEEGDKKNGDSFSNNAGSGGSKSGSNIGVDKSNAGKSSTMDGSFVDPIKASGSKAGRMSASFPASNAKGKSQGRKMKARGGGSSARSSRRIKGKKNKSSSKKSDKKKRSSKKASSSKRKSTSRNSSKR